MILKRFELFPYTIVNQPPINEHELVVPEGSHMIKVVAMSVGVDLWYEVPEVDTGNTQTDVYKIVKNETDVPPGYEFMDIVSTILDSDNGQVMLIFPIYKKYSDLNLPF